MNDSQAEGVLLRLFKLWPATPQMEPELLAYWIAFLKAQPHERALCAVEIAVNECRFFPSLAEFREFVADAASRESRPQRCELPAPPDDLSWTEARSEAAKHWIPILRETIRNAKKPSPVRGFSTFAENARAVLPTHVTRQPAKDATQ